MSSPKERKQESHWWETATQCRVHLRKHWDQCKKDIINKKLMDDTECQRVFIDAITTDMDMGLPHRTLSSLQMLGMRLSSDECLDILFACITQKRWIAISNFTWLLSRCNLYGTSTSQCNLLACMLRAPLHDLPSNHITAVEMACHGQLVWSDATWLMRDFSPAMVGRRLFVGVREVTKELPELFETHYTRFCPGDHVPYDLLLRHCIARDIQPHDWLRQWLITMPFKDSAGFDWLVATVRQLLPFIYVDRWLDVARECDPSCADVSDDIGMLMESTKNKLIELLDVKPLDVK